MGATPDDCILTVGLCQAVGVVDVGCPVASPLIELAEGCGLHCPVCCHHVSFVRCSYYRHRVAGSGGCLCQFFICHVSADLSPHARQNVGLVRLQAVVVDPLTIGPIPSNHETKDSTTGHACVTILSQGRREPTDLSSACEGVHLESPHALGNAAFGQVDVEHG